jgi:hypothetical protein
MLNFKCDKCGKKIQEPSALVFSPPFLMQSNAQPTVDKYHICVKCWDMLQLWIEE